jgi:hypothetical protein
MMDQILGFGNLLEVCRVTAPGLHGRRDLCRHNDCGIRRRTSPIKRVRFQSEVLGAIGNGKVVSGTGMGEDLEIGSLGDGKPGEFKAATS